MHVLDLSISKSICWNIYLYSEKHGVKKFLDKEFELWYDYYYTQEMRHLFSEYPYYTAEFLNIWMQMDNNEILNEIFADIRGTLGVIPEAKEFYQKIKKGMRIFRM